MNNFNKLSFVLLLYLTGSSQVTDFNIAKRDTIARTAEKYIGNMNWAVYKKKGRFPPGTKKCNKFVYDVLQEAGLTAPTYTSGWPLVAADWANASYRIPGWMHMGYGVSWKRGDIIAERRDYSDATGHCGIAISNSQVVGEQANNVTTEGHDFEPNAAVRRYRG